MPNYEYECVENAHRFEVWQPVGEAAPLCPECGSVVRKIFHVPRVIFKGSGFYVTDLRSEKEAGGKKSGSSNESSTSSSNDAASTTTSTSSDAATPAASKDAGSSTSTTSSAASGAPDKFQSSSK